MGRISIEERAWPRIPKLARRCGWTKEQALWKLCHLWRASQEILAVDADAEDITDWMQCAQDEAQTVLDGLLECKILERKEDGTFRIKGNEDHVMKIQVLRENGSKGGKRRASKANAQANAIANAQANEVKQTSSTAQHRCIKSSSSEANSSSKRSGIPDEVRREWEASLAWAGRTPKWIRDEEPLFRIYMRVKDWARVRNALAGFRGEKGDDGYDPADHVRLNRLGDIVEAAAFEHLESIGERVLSGSQGSAPRTVRTPEEQAELDEFDRQMAELESQRKARSAV